MKRIVALALFLSSYAPLFAIFVLRDLQLVPASIYIGSIAVPFFTPTLSSPAWLAGIMGVLILVPNLYVLTMIKVVSRKLSPEILEASRVVPKGSEVLNYIATYIIPFATEDWQDFGEIAALILLFVVLAVLYIRANLYYINPMLAFAGYRIFEIECSNPVGTVYVITRSGRLTSGTPIRGVNLTDVVFLEVATHDADS